LYFSKSIVCPRNGRRSAQLHEEAPKRADAGISR
jgi:hypothetical protein